VASIAMMTPPGPSVAPGPTGAQMLRQVVAIRRDPISFLTRCVAAYGDVVSFPLPGHPAVLVNDPAAVDRVLRENHRAYGKDTVQYRSLAAVAGEGLLTADGERWLAQRRLVQPAFHARTLAAAAGHVGAAVEVTVAEWDRLADGARVDVDAAMMRLALDVVGRALLGADLREEGARLVAAVLSALDVVVARARTGLTVPAWAPTPLNRQLARALRTLDAAVERIVAERRARSEPGQDVLGLLVAGAQPGPEGDRMLRDEVVTLIVAGHETVASGLTWTWHLLAGAPEATRRLQAEVDAVLATPTALELADLGRLPWTRAVVEEALRLYPPAWVVSRRARADDVLAGYPVPRGSLVLVSPYVLHRHGASWPDPERFDPERFLDAPSGPRPAYVPFGAGPRLCIGRDFALLEAVLVVAALSRRYELGREPGHAVRADALVTIRPRGGLPMRIRRRRRSGAR